MLLKLILLIVFVSTLEAKQAIGQSTAFFRSDYIYDGISQAFYKAHKEARKWNDAVFRCAAEGATLTAPSTEGEMRALLRHMDGLTSVFLGIHDIYEEGAFVTLNGTPISDIYSNWYVNEPDDANGNEDCVVINSEGFYIDVRCDIPRSFMCKKDLKTLTSNPVCETYDTEYFYSSKMNRCYKIHKTGMSWFNAYKICSLEQSHLAVINSADEAAVLVDALKMHPVASVKGVQYVHVVFIGFNDVLAPGDFRTIHGQTLAEAGYKEWNKNQPDGAGRECGVLNRDGGLHDTNCNIKLLFICEKPLGTTVSLSEQGSS